MVVDNVDAVDLVVVDNVDALDLVVVVVDNADALDLVVVVDSVDALDVVVVDNVDALELVVVDNMRQRGRAGPGRHPEPRTARSHPSHGHRTQLAPPLRLRDGHGRGLGGGARPRRRLVDVVVGRRLGQGVPTDHVQGLRRFRAVVRKQQRYSSQGRSESVTEPGAESACMPTVMRVPVMLNESESVQFHWEPRRD